MSATTNSLGGGIYNGVGGTTTVDGSTVSANTAKHGGGIYNWGALDVTDSTIGAPSVPSADDRASRWPSCEWNRPAFGPQAASGWRLIRRPVSPRDAELFNTQMAIRQRLQDQEGCLR